MMLSTLLAHPKQLSDVATCFDHPSADNADTNTNSSTACYNLRKLINSGPLTVELSAMKTITLSNINTAVVFRNQAPQEDPMGNVRALAIRDLVGSRPPEWSELHRVRVDEKYLNHCLQPGDVVIPSRGDYYKAWLFEDSSESVLPIGQLNIIRPQDGLNARYLAWYLNQKSTQDSISLILTGTSIKALTKAALLKLKIEIPPLPKQHQIAEIDHTCQEIVALRLRINEKDKEEVAHLTKKILREG